MRYLCGILLTAIASQAAAQAPNDEMLLVCDGESFNRTETASVDGWAADNHGNSATGGAALRELKKIPFQVRLRISDGIAEMSVPAAAAPEINENKGGWFPVKKLAIGDNEITGKVRFNMFSSSTFRVDRRTGAITTSGGFSGHCKKADLGERAF